MASLASDLEAAIRTIPDYPKEGILFRDITTLLGNPRAFRHPPRLAAGKLHDRRRMPRMGELSTRVGTTGDQIGTGHHLGNHKAGTQTVRQGPERRLRHAGHGRQKRAIGDRDAIDVEGCVKGRQD